MSKTSKGAILIFSDMEGASGLIDQRLIRAGTPFWRDYGRHLLTDDINTVAAACYSMGHKRVYLSEAHNNGQNSVREGLLPFITLLPPCSAQTNLKGSEVWEEIYRENNIEAAILVGIHAREGSQGFLAHTWDFGLFASLKINGQEYGEIGTMAALLGYYEIPLVCIVGDGHAAREAEECIPGIKAIAVKEEEDGGWVRALPPAKALKLISTQVSQCLEDFSSIKPFKFNGPISMTFALKNKEKLVFLEKESRVKISGETVMILADSYKDAYDIFWDCYMRLVFGIRG